MRSIVKIKHCNNFGYDNGKRFAFWAFEELGLGDLVVLDTQHGVSLGRVVEINLNPELVKDKPEREVIARVDFSGFDQRRERRSEMCALELDLHLMAMNPNKELQFERLAKENENFAEKLERYNQLKSEVG